MRRNIWWAVLVVAASLGQMTCLDAIRIQGVRPDLVLLLVIYFAVAEGEERAMLTGLLGGIYEDVAGDVVLGHHVLCNVVVGYLMGRVGQRLVLEHPVVKVGLVLIGSLLHGLLYTCIQYVQTPNMSALHTIIATVVPGAFYTAFATPVVFFLAARVFRRREETAGGVA